MHCINLLKIYQNSHHPADPSAWMSSHPLSHTVLADDDREEAGVQHLRHQRLHVSTERTLVLLKLHHEPLLQRPVIQNTMLLLHNASLLNVKTC